MIRTLLFSSEESNAIKQTLFLTAKLPSSAESEFEIRIKNANNLFSLIEFENLCDRLNKKAQSLNYAEETLYYAKNYRRIQKGIYGSSKPSKDDIYQKKIKGKDLGEKSVYDVNIIKFGGQEDISLRFAKSFEIPVSQDEFERESQGRILERKRRRWSYKFTNFQIDCSLVENFSNFDREIEIELNRDFVKLCQQSGNFIKLFIALKEAIGYIFPQIHTIATHSRFEEIRSLLIQQDGRGLPRDVRPVNIQESHLTKQMLNMAVTNKLDGVAYLLHISPETKKIVLYNSTDIIMLKPTKDIWNTVTNSISLVEVVEKDILELHLFESLSFQGTVVKKTLRERLANLEIIKNQVIDFGVEGIHVEVKRFFDSEDIIKNISDAVLYMTQRYGLYDCNESNDGIIFENKGLKTTTYKWKFPSKISIDFKLVKSAEQPTMGFTKYDLLVKDERGLAKFSEASFPSENKCDGVKCDNLNNQIVELAWFNGQFIVLRIRFDKTTPNFIKVAKETYRDMLNPPTLPFIISKIKQLGGDSKLAIQVPSYSPQDEFRKEIFIILTKFKKDIEANRKGEAWLQPIVEDSPIPLIELIDNIFLQFNKLTKTVNDDIENFQKGKYNSYFLEIALLYQAIASMINLKYGEDNFWFDAEIRQKLLAQNDYIFLTKVKDEISDKLSKASAQNYLEFVKKINTLYPPTPPQSPPQIEDTQIQPLFEDVDKMIASSIRKYQTSTQQPKWIYMINPNLNIIKAIKPLIGQTQSLFIIVDTEGLYKSFDIENNLVLFSNTNIVQTKEIDKTIVLHAKKFDVKPIDIVLFETGNLSSQVLLKQLDSFATNIIYVSKYSDAYLKNLVKVLDYPSFEIINIQNFNLFAFSPKTLKAFRGCFNKIKSDLIVTDCNNKIVLDIGAGMGGDLHKYSIAKVKKLYAVEPNKAFIEQFMERLKNIISLKNKVVLINTNGTDEKGIFDVVPQNSVNVVSMMYSLTYFFESKQMLQNLVNIIDKALVSTFSTVIGTVMDGYRVDELLADKIGVDKDLFSISVVNDKKGFGKKLKVDLKQTKTAQDLTEYAVYIDLFSELLEEKGIFLTYLDDMVDCSTFNDEEKLLSSLYISFAYSRGIKVRDNLFRIKTTGDGSCLFHAVGQALVGPSYRDSVGVELRKNIASKFTLDEYNFLLDGLKGTSDFYLALEDAKELKNCKGLKQEIGDLLSQSDSPFILEKINNSLLTDENKDICYSIVLSCYSKTKSELEKISTYAETFTIYLIEQYLGINILVFISNQKSFQKVSSWIENAPTVLVYNDKELHFETIRIIGRDTSIISFNEAKKLL